MDTLTIWVLIGCGLIVAGIIGMAVQYVRGK